MEVATRFMRANGKETVETDPSRSVWYSALCSYWTDNWSKLVRVGPGIPACPHCKAVGYMSTAAEFLSDDRHPESEPPAKEKCNRVLTSWLGG